jgi:peroxiredoxin
VAEEDGKMPDERPQRRREYSGASSTLGLALLVVLVVGAIVYWFEFRGDSGGDRVGGEGFGVQPLDEALNPTGRAPAGAIGRAAPNFHLQTADQQGAVTLSHLRGQWVLVNFWASWCAPCIAETPALQQFSEEMADKGLVILGVNQQETPGTAAGFADRFEVTYPIILDRDGEVSIAYRVSSGLPITMLIRPDGVIERVFRGAVDEEEFATIRLDVAP